VSDEIQALMAKVETLAQVVEGLRVELLSGRRVRPASAPRRAMQSASATDRQYGLENGTAHAAYLSGQVRGQVRPGFSRTGRVLWISAVDAERVWGGQRVARTA
jgi:hypothetical protein